MVSAQAQRLPEHLRYGQYRLSVLSCALELGDVVVDRVEADVLAVDPERHEHHLHVDKRSVLSPAACDPMRAPGLERLAGHVPPFVAKVSPDNEVVDQPTDRLFRE